MLQIGYYRTFLITSWFLNYPKWFGIPHYRIITLYIIAFSAHYIITSCFWYWAFLIHLFFWLFQRQRVQMNGKHGEDTNHTVSDATPTGTWSAAFLCHIVFNIHGSLRGKRNCVVCLCITVWWRASQVPARLQQHFVLLSMARWQINEVLK